MKPLNGHIILKEIQEKKLFKGIIIPQQLAANQITFAQVVALPEEKLNTKNLKENDYVILGYSPVWEKKFKHKIYDKEYLIVDEYSILAIIKDNKVMELLNLEEK